MNTCPNCGKMAGIHGSILQGCTCQWQMAAPPQRPVALPHKWVGLTDEERTDIFRKSKDQGLGWLIHLIEAKLKEKNQ